ncbi:MAG: hypothetical protein PHR19_07640 [Bacteroidales bacterium]|jgi:hypothetical protein|nr:hypothetical protein [Bacteroidales bacterium]
MKRITILFLLLFSATIAFSQQKHNKVNNHIIIRYAPNYIDYPIAITGYTFLKVGKHNEFIVWDSLSYSYVRQRVDSLVPCYDNDRPCRFPNVVQQIVIVNGNEYDILSSNGTTAMEKNGRSVVFDKELQDAINRAIEKYDKQLPPEERFILKWDDLLPDQRKK